MNIKALKPFVLRDSTSGELTSFACGQIYTVSAELGAQLVSDGLAVAVTEIVPTGTKTITANGTYDVAQYADVEVNVGTLTVTYDENGGTGSVDAQTVIAGNSISLDDGTGLTAPAGKEFAGWATTSSATEPDVESPYTPTANVTLYAVWVDE